MTQDSDEVEVSEAQIAAHWKEEERIAPPPSFVAQANMADPAADLVWDAVGTIVDVNGENHWEPETEEDWIAVRYGAMSMIEAGNLLMMETRARDQDQWIRLSEAMMDAGTLMFQAAEAEDADRVFALGEEVYATCNNCHMLYWVGDADRGRAIESPSGGAAP